MERKINEVFQDGGVMLKVTEIDYNKMACGNCYYYSCKNIKCWLKMQKEVSGSCIGAVRSDKKYVIFELQEQAVIR